MDTAAAPDLEFVCIVQVDTLMYEGRHGNSGTYMGGGRGRYEVDTWKERTPFQTPLWANLTNLSKKRVAACLPMRGPEPIPTS